MAKEKAKKKEYAEFKYDGETFSYTGRVYPAKKKTNPFIYLTLNGVFTIQCHLIDGKKSSFLSFPSYKSGDEYKSQVYIDKELNDEMEELIEVIDKALDSLED